MGRKEPGYEPVSTNHCSIQRNEYEYGGIENSMDDDHKYEHFPVVCPSCKGKGEICENDSELVTFVPVKDERLKPARTKLKIFILLVILSIAGGLATFFLYPRSVVIHVEAHSILDFRFKRNQNPWIQYTFDVSIENNYYLKVALKDVSLSLLYQQMVVGTANISQPINIGMRGKQHILVPMNVSYDGNQIANKIWQQCYLQRDYLGQVIRSSGELSYWMYNEHLTGKQDYFYADCGSLVFPGDLTTKPYTTTTVTTAITNTDKSRDVTAAPSLHSSRARPRGDIVTYKLKSNEESGKSPFPVIKATKSPKYSMTTTVGPVRTKRG